MKARASRIALNVASEPELTNRTRSGAGDEVADPAGASRDRLVVQHGEEMGTARGLRRDGADHCLVGMPEDQRPRPQAVVDVLVAAGVPEAGALPVAEHERNVVRQPRRPHHAAREHRLGVREVIPLGVAEPPVASD